MKRISVEEVQSKFSDVVDLVIGSKKRILIRADSRNRAALISLEDLALLESLDGDRRVSVEHVEEVKVQQHLRADMWEVANRKERIIILRDGKGVVALVPGRDVSKLEILDDQLDMEAARRLLDEELKRDH